MSLNLDVAKLTGVTHDAWHSGSSSSSSINGVSFFLYRKTTLISQISTDVYVSNKAPIGTKLCQNAFQTIPDVSFFDAEIFLSAKISDRKFRFSLIWCGFRGATAERSSKSASSSNFASDRLILRSMRSKISRIMSVQVLRWVVAGLRWVENKTRWVVPVGSLLVGSFYESPTKAEISNGRKIAGMPPISMIFGHRSRQPDLFFLNCLRRRKNFVTKDERTNDGFGGIASTWCEMEVRTPLAGR